jgi:iron complex outermembrane receptor protein
MQSLDAASLIIPGSDYAYSDVVAHNPWTPKFGMEMRTLANALTYVSATKGFKSGGFNLTSRERGLGYAPEWAWSYEAGVKAPLAGGRATANLAVFRTVYDDLQVQSGIRPGLIDITNAAAATIRGVEVEASARLGPALMTGGHLTWLDARYDRYIATGAGGVTGDVAGNRLNNAPVWSGRVWAEWGTGLAGASVLSVRAESTWQSTVFYTAFNTSVERQRPYGLLGMSADYGPQHRRWSISAYARNLANQDYVTGTFGTPATAIGSRPGDPRQVGIQFAVRL